MSAAPSRPPGSSRDNVIGAVLVAAAVIVGVVLLAQGYDEEGRVVSVGESAEQTTTTTTAAGGGQGPAESTTTTSTTTARPPAQVPVLAANGAGVPGAAGSLAEQLQAAGYTTVDTANTNPVDATTVYFAEGAQAEAQAVATVVGTDPAVVHPVADSPVSAGEALVVVVIGPDTAT